MNIHPDDILFFHEIHAAMRRVAKQYDLPLKSVAGLTMPAKGMADRMGECSASGEIRLVLRCTVNGEWCDAPMSPEEVMDTAAHELAHLRHFNHGLQFQEFEDELKIAIRHQQKDHREKVIERLVKMQKSRESENEIGNTAAAEAFASMINHMLVEYELQPSDIDYARTADNDPVIEIEVDLSKYRIAEKRTRIAWQESLARVVAKAHLCSFLLRPGSNKIWFVGTRSHALVAEYAYGVLVPAAHKMSLADWHTFYVKCKKELGSTEKAHGFHNAWLMAFVERISDRFNESRKAAVAAAPEGTTTAMIRLDGALVRVRAYIDDKFKSRRSAAARLNGGSTGHPEGRAAGRAAADRMVLSKAVGTTSPKRLGGRS